MKPRSSTEICALSSGRNSPLRYAVSFIAVSRAREWGNCRAKSTPARCRRSAEQQPQRVPAASQDAGNRDALQRDHRHLAVRLALERQLDRADALSDVD